MFSTLSAIQVWVPAGHRNITGRWNVISLFEIWPYLALKWTQCAAVLARSSSSFIRVYLKQDETAQENDKGAGSIGFAPV